MIVVMLNFTAISVSFDCCRSDRIQHESQSKQYLYVVQCDVILQLRWCLFYRFTRTLHFYCMTAVFNFKHVLMTMAVIMANY